MDEKQLEIKKAVIKGYYMNMWLSGRKEQ